MYASYGFTTFIYHPEMGFPEMVVIRVGGRDTGKVGGWPRSSQMQEMGQAHAPGQESSMATLNTREWGGGAGPQLNNFTYPLLASSLERTLLLFPLIVSLMTQ
jgi:hypothetical protein